MGELERQDWREVLATYKIEQILAALDHLMKEPPKMTLGDGSVQPYTGRPTLANVTQAITELQELSAAEYRRRQSERFHAEMRDLEKRRANGEKFYGMADLAAEFKRIADSKLVPASENREAELAAQKEKLLKRK